MFIIYILFGMLPVEKVGPDGEGLWCRGFATTVRT